MQVILQLKCIDWLYYTIYNGTRPELNMFCIEYNHSNIKICKFTGCKSSQTTDACAHIDLSPLQKLSKFILSV